MSWGAWKELKRLKEKNWKVLTAWLQTQMGVVQFTSSEDTRAEINQTVADRTWLPNGFSNFVSLKATEPFRVTQFVPVWLDEDSKVPAEEPGRDRRLETNPSPHSLPVISWKCKQWGINQIFFFFHNPVPPPAPLSLTIKYEILNSASLKHIQ